MKVYLLKDVAGIGMAGQIVKVKDGYGQNFLVPRKLAVGITAKNESFFASKVSKVKADQAVIKTKMGMLAEHIRNIHVSIKKRSHDDGKLYGAVSADEMVAALARKDIAVNKKQVVFPKSIKTVGEHKVTIKLSSKMQPQCNVKVVAAS